MNPKFVALVCFPFSKTPSIQRKMGKTQITLLWRWENQGSCERECVERGKILKLSVPAESGGGIQKDEKA